MATNVKFKRDAISIMRDGIKSQYKRGSSCEICGVSEDLELHHYHTVAQLVKKFAKDFQLDFNDEEVILANRDKFYKLYWHELVEATTTLCAHHHQQLHRVYSKEPPLFTASKQAVWVVNQREKFLNPHAVPEAQTDGTGFSKFIIPDSGFERFIPR